MITHLKNIDTMKVGERFSYETINIDELRKLMPLEEWLKKSKRARAKMRWNTKYSSDDFPPGHPKYFLYEPENYTGKLKDVLVIPDPENLAFHEVEYAKENGYKIESYQELARNNKYYVVFPFHYKKLWIPLSFDHPRMKLWEKDIYYHHSGYKGHDGKTFYTPIETKVRRPTIDPNWKEDYQLEKLRSYYLEAEAERNEIDQYLLKYATPENHCAPALIKKFFLDYKINLDLLQKRNTEGLESYRWFYRYATLEDQENDPIHALQTKKNF